MSKPVLVVVHGIGVHTKESIEKTVNTAATNALKRYRFWDQNEDFKKYVDIVGIGYDDIFEKERKLIGDNVTALKAMLVGMNFADSVIEQLEKVTKDEFLNTHVLDVIFYAGLHSERVRLRALETLAEQLKGRSDVHVLCHSMGTAVVHDALHKAYTGGFDAKEDVKLSTHKHKIESLWMFANTSQLFYDWNPLRTNIDPRTSIVSPAADKLGCVYRFYNITHKFDLIGTVRPFKAPSSWARYQDDLQLDFYRDIKTENFYTSKNPHDLGQYLEDPLVSEAFLTELMPSHVFDPTPDEHAEAADKVTSLNENVHDVVDFAKDEIKNVDDFATFVKLIRDLKKKFDDM